jgi:hypothetical protein
LTFTIEIYGAASDGSEALLHRTTVTSPSPAAARREAGYLLTNRKKATHACVLNPQGEMIYKVSK